MTDVVAIRQVEITYQAIVGDDTSVSDFGMIASFAQRLRANQLTGHHFCAVAPARAGEPVDTSGRFTRPRQAARLHTRRRANDVAGSEFRQTQKKLTISGRFRRSLAKVPLRSG
jgi:hypothetical protein